MKKPITLSIIIPAYNEEEHIGSCLDAIAAQTVAPDEVIVVDNNSTDTTVKIAKSYSFVRVVKARDQGIVYARNKGFDSAKSSYIGRIDSDSLLPNNWVEQIKHFYELPDYAASALTGRGYFYNSPFPRFSKYVLGLLAFWVNRAVLGHHFLYGSNMVLPRLVWQDVRSSVCLRNDVHEDIDIAIHVHNAGYKIVYRPRIVVGVKLRRVFQDQSKLWANLMLWPQSLRIHGRKLWFTGFIGAVILYVLTPLVYPIKGLQVLRKKVLNIVR